MRPEMRILITEDDASSRILLTKKLSAWGHEVVAADNGNQAWDAIGKERPDIAILDYEI